MKTLKFTLNLFFSLFIIHYSFSQDITTDTTLANEYLEMSMNYKNNYKYDSALFYIDKAQVLYIKHLGENSIKNAKCLSQFGLNNYYISEFDKSLEYFNKALNIRIELEGEKTKVVAAILNNMGLNYTEISNYEKALECFFKCVEIRLELLGENSVDVASLYNNMGIVYDMLTDYDKALDYFTKSLEINLEIIGEKSVIVASTFCNIGIAYFYKTEYNKALDFWNKSLAIRLELLGEINTEVADTYLNIGNIYAANKENDKALEYYFKNLAINEQLSLKKNYDIISTYSNIGSVYDAEEEYDKALEYFFEALKVNNELKNQKSHDAINLYNNIGIVYRNKSDYSKALENTNKSLELSFEILNEKNAEFATSYNNLAAIYINAKQFDKALYYLQKKVVCSLKNFSDTVNFYAVPPINNYLRWNELFDALNDKAEILADTTKNLVRFSETLQGLDRQELALRHYQACDTLITLVRKEITTQSDKIALGKKVSEVYKDAANLSYELGMLSDKLNKTGKTTHNSSLNTHNYESFYFSERNKSSVLLEALAGSDALKFAGITQELLNKEHNLSIDIASYTTLKNNAENDSVLNIWSNLLFDTNRSYDSLMLSFENDYPEYYQLKYNNYTVTVLQIQEILDKKSAMLSYFLLDSSIVIYCITKNGFEIYKSELPETFIDDIDMFRAVIQSNSKSAINYYTNFAFSFYKILFPVELLSNPAIIKTENLIIIPDGSLSSIPFEALFTQEYTKEYTNMYDKKYFSEMPYLIKKYAISYSYSATLFYNTFPTENTKIVEIKKINDFIAFAPVFDDKNIAGTTLLTRELLAGLEKNFSDSTITTRAYLRDGTYVAPLPGTLTEVESIFKMFDDKGLNAVTKLHKHANEDFTKSGELAYYKYIHFATHGFVNTEKPELSGILLAQDTSLTFESNEDMYGNVAQQNDGILYQSEIYNLELNSDLVVLSACETGLGKITSGEGVIGLTRALLYAGTKNIVVSLWSVSDESTSQLMINFYSNLLNSKKQTELSKDLRKAKLQLVESGTYAHPFYWSPFILIGK